MQHEEGEELAAILSQLAQSSAPLSDGLRAAAEETPRGRLRHALEQLAEASDSGQPLEEAVAADNAPVWLKGFVAAGMRSGSLGHLLAQVIGRQRKMQTIWVELRAAIFYPVSIAVIAFVLTIALGGRIAADTEMVFREFNFEIPYSAMLFFETMKYAPIVVASASVALLVATLLMRFVGGVRRWHALLASLPVFGSIRKWSAVGQLSQLTAILLKMDVPLNQALKLAARGVGDEACRAAGFQLADSTEAGSEFSRAVNQSTYLPQVFESFVRCGEESSALPESLSAATDAFDGMIQIRSAAIRMILPPMTFVFVGVNALYIYSVALSPMVALSNMI